MLLEAISKMQITFKDKARADEKAEHTREYVSILRRSATPYLGVRCIFEIAYSSLSEKQYQAHENNISKIVRL